MLYKLTDIKQILDHKTILDIQDLEIQKGLIYSLSGPNGAGKTTLLNILSFLDIPSTGTMTFKGKPVLFHETSLQLLRRRAILLDQHPILFTTTVFKNLEFGLKLRKITKTNRKRVIEESLDMVGLSHFMHEPAVGLSGGETQRVALARIIALSPEVLLCDEPTSSVDNENRNKIINLLKRINREKKVSIVFTSHDTQHTSLLADKTLHLSLGKHITGGHENIFQGVIMSTDKKADLIIEETLSIPVTKKKSGIVKISLDPEKIRLFSSDSEKRVSATIIRMTKDGNHIRTEADTGIIITLILTHQEVAGRHLTIGSKIFLEFSEESVLYI